FYGRPYVETVARSADDGKGEAGGAVRPCALARGGNSDFVPGDAVDRQRAQRDVYAREPEVAFDAQHDVGAAFEFIGAVIRAHIVFPFAVLVHGYPGAPRERIAI